MGLFPLQVWIENLGRMEVEALGHTVDPYSGAQMGLGITGTYISPPLDSCSASWKRIKELEKQQLPVQPNERILG